MRPIGGPRHRLQRDRRGVVSAIATMFGLLLVVVMISNFIIAPLPAQETNSETQHVLQVEDQMAAFQSAISLESRPGSLLVSHTLPITLGSGAVPPFGTSASSTLEIVGAAAATQDSFSVTQAVPLNISWSQSFPSCNNCKALYYNISYNKSVGQTISARGQAGFGVIMNILGDNNSDLTVDLRGNANYAYVIVAGSNNSIVFTDRGKGSCNNQSIILYGQYNTINLGNLTSCGYVNVVFITSTNPSNPSSTKAQCPANNSQLMQTNKIVYPPSSANNSLFMNQTEWFENGITVPFHLVRASDGYWFQNETLTVFGVGSSGTSPGCAFTKSVTTGYSMSSSASLVVHISNQYSAPADVAFEQGAVIEQTAGGIPQMIDPPILSTAPFTPLGFSGNITMMSFVGSPSAVSGTGVVGLTTKVVSVNRLLMGEGPSPFFFGGFRFAVTTAYPQAWAGYFAANPTAFPSALVSCSSTGPSPHTVSCNAPAPTGGFVLVRATLNVQAIAITFITCSVSFT